MSLEIKNGFPDYAAVYPERKTETRHISYALRIAGIDTMDELRERYRLGHDDLLNIRGISFKRLELIGEILQFYEAMAPPSGNEKIEKIEIM